VSILQCLVANPLTDQYTGIFSLSQNNDIIIMSSNPRSCTAPCTTVAGTLTGSIQDIAALLHLLGTEQCEDHVSSALTKGYLYAAASPISLFGSLDVARAGFKTFVASLSIPAWNIVGARTLSNMGFRPQGELIFDHGRSE
jgi:hypothetical protein